jgi:hypothetical protein
MRPPLEVKSEQGLSLRRSANFGAELRSGGSSSGSC